METFCYWKVKKNKYADEFICTGRLFAGHVGNCPYERVSEAILKCPEVLLRKGEKRYEKPKIYTFASSSGRHAFLDRGPYHHVIPVRGPTNSASVFDGVSIDMASEDTVQKG